MLTQSNSFLPYGCQEVDSEDVQAIVAALQGDWITRGPKVAEFEQAVADRVGARFAVAFNSGTSALQGCYFACETRPFDRILSTPNTFIATAGMGRHYGAEPIFLDIDRSTGNLDLSQIAENINQSRSRGRTIFAPVHFAGIAMDMQRVDHTISDPETIVIEDACHAIGSLYPDGSPVGNCQWSHMTVFSFHPVKHMTTGEGGLVTTNSEELLDRLRRFRNNGIVRSPEADPWYYEVQDLTGNFHMTDFQAALGLSQLTKLDRFVERRRSLMKAYRSRLSSTQGIRLFDESADDRTAYHLCVAQIDFDAFKKSRKEVMLELKERGVGTQVHYIPTYRHPVFAKENPGLQEFFPEMEAYYSQALSLPLFPRMEEKDVERVCTQLLQVLGG